VAGQRGLAREVRFFVSYSTTWNPVTDEFGAYPFLYGTVVTSVVALIISVPIGVGAAIYLSELAGGKWSDALTFLVELLAVRAERDLTGCWRYSRSFR
jgi:ABC-type phosphate transport system permease subunit